MHLDTFTIQLGLQEEFAIAHFLHGVFRGMTAVRQHWPVKVNDV